MLLARRWHVADLRRVGSGNLGAANVMRASGVTAGILVALLDMTKGAASVWLAERFTTSAVAPAAAGVAAIVGHIYPVWLRFRGGKGVATACGVFSLLTPLAVPPAVAIFIAVAWLTKYISLGSVLASRHCRARLSHRQSSGGGRRRQRGGDAHHLPSSIQYDLARARTEPRVGARA
jgi:glycerol-3-phosphate acyltransferase PlsY